MVNKVILIGNLGADPEMRFTQSGTAVANFRMATSERFKDQSGEWQERTEWHRVVFFGRTAEVCGEYLTKGRPVYVEGRLQTRSWDDKDGNSRYSNEVVGLEMKMLGQRGDGGSPRPKPSRPASPPEPQDDFEDDIPF